MYALDEVAADAARFRDAFARAEGFRPLSVKIKLLYGCNLRCEMCNHWRQGHPPALTTERLKDVLSELGSMGCRKVHFTGGEPALRSDLEDLVGHATSVGIRPTLTTNGTLFTRERARRIVAAGLRGVNVSIDSPDADVHDRVRGVAGAWDRAVLGLKNLHEGARRGRLALALNTVITRLNYLTLDRLPHLAARVGARALRLMPVDDHTGAGLKLTPDEIARYNREVGPPLARAGLAAGLFRDEDQAYPFGREGSQTRLAAEGSYALGYYDSRPCFAPFTHALLDQRGRVFVCCTANHGPQVGSVSERPFAQTWTSVAFRRVRSDMRDGRPLSACAHCDDFVDENRRMFEILEGEGPPRGGRVLALPRGDEGPPRGDRVLALPGGDEGN